MPNVLSNETKPDIEIIDLFGQGQWGGMMSAPSSVDKKSEVNEMVDDVPIPMALPAPRIVVEKSSQMNDYMGEFKGGRIKVGGIDINADKERILIGQATAPLVGVGIYLGLEDTDFGYDARFGDPAGEYFHWDASLGTMTVVGISQVVDTFTAGYAIDASDAVFMHTDGKVYPAHAGHTSHIKAFIGFATEAVAAEASVNVLIAGSSTDFSGLTGGSRYYLQEPSTSASISNDSGSPAGAIPSGENTWQSFTVGGSDIDCIAIQIEWGTAPTGSGTFVCRLRTGEGTGGTLLATSDAMSHAASGFKTFYFSTPITLSASTQYSWTLDLTAGDDGTLSESAANPYSGGRNNNGASNDYDFKVLVEASSSMGSIGATPATLGMSFADGTSDDKQVGIAMSATKLLLVNGDQ